MRAFDALGPKFGELDTDLYGVSVDSQFSHKAWLESGTLMEDKQLRHSLVSDLTKNISRDYGVLNEGGIALRGTFIVDPNGKILYYECANTTMGRNVDNVMRTLLALQHNAKTGGAEECPVNWQPGGDVIKLG